MKILYYSPHPHHDIVSDVGYSVHQVEMIKAFKLLGHDVQTLILGGTSQEELPDYIKSEGQGGIKGKIKRLIPKKVWNTVRDYKKYILHDKQAKDKLRSFISEHKPDLIYERSEYLLKSGVELANELGIPHILEVNAPFVDEWKQFEGDSFLNDHAHKVEDFKLKNTDMLSVISTSLKDYLFDKYNLPNTRKFQIIPNGVDPELFSEADEQDIDSLRNELNLENTIVIGFVGSIMPYHGVDTLLSIFSDILKDERIPNIRLLIVGGGQTMSDLQKQSKDLDIESKVVFTDHIKRDLVPNYIELMDICVLPNTNWYCSPIKIFEYAVRGKTIVAPNTSPVLEVFEAGVEILVFENKVGLKQTLKGAILNSNKLTEIGQRARKKVIENYSWKKLAKQLFENRNK